MTLVALEAESTLTNRFQTTVRSAVHQALKLSKNDKIKYTIQLDGSVVISRIEQQENDPVLDEFLSFLASNMKNHPDKIAPLTKSMRKSVDTLVKDVDIDLDSPLLAEDE